MRLVAEGYWLPSVHGMALSQGYETIFPIAKPVSSKL
jgi:hypothetical protein